MDYREMLGVDSEVEHLRAALRDLAVEAARATEMSERGMAYAASHLTAKSVEVAESAARVRVLREALASLK